MEASKPLQPICLDIFSLTSCLYAPRNLRHLKQPVPNDLPPENGTNIFTFEDAFEDLLVASQGNHLPDIHDRFNQRSLLRQMFPNGEPTWFWLRRLESQGLIKLSGLGGFGGMFRPHVEGFLQNQLQDWENLHTHLENQLVEPWRRAISSSSHRDTDQNKHGGLSHASRKTLKGTDDIFRGAGDAFGGPRPMELPKTRIQSPENFDDLFSAVTSSFSEGQKTWDTFVKLLEGSNRAKYEKQRQSEQDEEISKEAVTENEHVDRFGYLHKTITRKTLDKYGNEIGVETRVIIAPTKERFTRQADGTASQTNVIDRSNDENHQQSLEKREGWFWK